MTGGFGARLRKRRETQNIDLAAIADQTKIKRSLLEALERDDLSHWPCGIFRRAWFRSYAQAIGLDPDSSVREFLEAHPDPEEIAAAVRRVEDPAIRADLISKGKSIIATRSSDQFVKSLFSLFYEFEKIRRNWP